MPARMVTIHRMPPWSSGVMGDQRSRSPATAATPGDDMSRRGRCEGAGVPAARGFGRGSRRRGGRTFGHETSDLRPPTGDWPGGRGGGAAGRDDVRDGTRTEVQRSRAGAEGAAQRPGEAAFQGAVAVAQGWRAPAASSRGQQRVHGVAAGSMGIVQSLDTGPAKPRWGCGRPDGAMRALPAPATQARREAGAAILTAPRDIDGDVKLGRDGDGSLAAGYPWHLWVCDLDPSILGQRVAASPTAWHALASS